MTLAPTFPQPGQTNWGQPLNAVLQEIVDAINAALTGGGSGAVDSVAGRTGDVLLSLADLTDSATIVTDDELASALSTALADYVTNDGLTTFVTSAIAGKVDQTRLVAGHALSTDVTLSKSDVGLGSVDNTSDAGKPVSVAQQAALDLKAPLASPAFTGVPTAPTAASGTNNGQVASTAFVKAALDTLIGGAPGALDTLKEIDDQLANDESALSALVTTVGTKVPQTRTVAGHALSADVLLSQDDIGDGVTNRQYTAAEKSKLAGVASGAEVNVNADWSAASGDAQILNKPALGTAAAAASTDFATAAQGAKADSAVQPAALTPLAPLASPALTGSPTAPTQTARDNGTKLATTGYVDAKIMDASGQTWKLQPISQSDFDALAGVYAPYTIYLEST